MKNIFKKEEFLKERQSADEKRDFMYKEIKNYISLFTMNELDLDRKGSFMNDSYYKADYKSDIKKLNDFLIKSFNYDLDKFFKEYDKEIYSDDFFVSQCGFIDALLYTYDQKYPLSGFPLQKNTGNDEVVIKYEYGYQNYDLGKKYLLQNFNTLEDFYFDCANNFFTYHNDKSGFKYFTDIEKNLYKFSLVDKKNKGSLCVFDVHKFYELYKDSSMSRCYDEICAIDVIKTDIKGLKYKYFEDTNIMIVASGDIDLDDINDQEILDYSEQIDLQENVKKYNII